MRYDGTVHRNRSGMTPMVFSALEKIRPGLGEDVDQICNTTLSILGSSLGVITIPYALKVNAHGGGGVVLMERKRFSTCHFEFASFLCLSHSALCTAPWSSLTHHL
jgi:hypothetical protein